MRIGLALCSLLYAAAPAAAQTVPFDEAVRINFALAAQFCITPGVDGPTQVGWFRAAGFTATRSTTGPDNDFTFEAPGRTAVAEIYYGQMPEYCRASTEYLGVTGASAILDSLAPRLWPGFVRRMEQGAVDPATGRPALCVSYEDPANPIGLRIGVTSDIRAPAGCRENGTSVIFTTYRV